MSLSRPAEWKIYPRDISNIAEDIKEVNMNIFGWLEYLLLPHLYLLKDPKARLRTLYSTIFVLRTIILVKKF